MFIKLLGVLKAFIGILNPKKWGVLAETYAETKFDFAFDISWSQGGEDKGLILAFEDLGVGTYVDVGAHHPSRFSVTRKLVNLGWSGVNIDANPESIKAFQKVRPKDVNIWACVGVEKQYKFTIFKEAALSTASSEWRSKFIEQNREISSEIVVPGISLRSVFDTYLGGEFPVLLCIDAEGTDLEVLQSAGIKNGFGPDWILLEAAPPLREVQRTPAVKYALDLGYEIHLILGMSTLLHKKS